MLVLRALIVLMLLWGGHCLRKIKRSGSSEMCIGHAASENRSNMTGMQSEAACSIFYSFLRIQFG